MAFFGKKNEGGFMDIIRCDIPEYLIWKWTPSGEPNTTRKEIAIRWGSSLRVKAGEVAVFVYKRDSGVLQDFIEGPQDDIVKTANLPVLSNIIGLAYAGNTPFQAEVYFINLAGNIQIKFGVPYFDVFDPRFLDFAVPIAARGSLTFNITDYRGFIKLHRLISFELEDFSRQIKEALTKYVKSYISNLPSDKGIPVLQIERKILEINEQIEPHIKKMFSQDFGVNLKRFDLSAIEPDKNSVGYQELRNVTAVQQSRTIDAQTAINIQNLDDTQRINAQNVEMSLQIQREEAQRKQKLQTESQHLTAHQIDQQSVVLTAAADSLGTMGNMVGGEGGGGGGMNPAGMMTGLMLGGAMGGQMANMMNQVGQNVHHESNAIPPAPPQIQYSISRDGQSAGPFNWLQLQEMISNGQLNKGVYVWKQGMSNWEAAGNVQELAPLFATPPPLPTVPS